MGKSSKDKRDAYYRLAKEQGWRARSAFKLLQLDEEFNLFEGVTRVVDLCAAPGSWSQVLSRVLIKGEKFGRSAWLEKNEKMKQQILAAADESDEDDNEEYEEEFEDDGQSASIPRLPSKETPLEPQVSSDTQPQFPVALPLSPPTPRKDVKIVAIDLQPMSPLEGITTLRADITHPSTIPMLLQALDPDAQLDPRSTQAAHPVDLILSDGAPDVTGLHDLDIYIQSQLLWAALNLSLCVLRPGGTFVAKIFRAKDVGLLYAQLRLVFGSVDVAKPRSSRASSLEAFVVCRDFAPPKGFVPSLENPLGAGRDVDARRPPRTVPYRRRREDGVTELELGSEDDDEDDEGGVPGYFKGTAWIAPFLACGDLGEPDADATYQLPKDYKSLDPVQPPTAPPYKEALEMRKTAGGAYGKTKR